MEFANNESTYAYDAWTKLSDWCTEATYREHPWSTYDRTLNELCIEARESCRRVRRHEKAESSSVLQRYHSERLRRCLRTLDWKHLCDVYDSEMAHPGSVSLHSSNENSGIGSAAFTNRDNGQKAKSLLTVVLDTILRNPIVWPFVTESCAVLWDVTILRSCCSGQRQFVRRSKTPSHSLKLLRSSWAECVTMLASTRTSHSWYSILPAVPHNTNDAASCDNNNDNSTRRLVVADMTLLRTIAQCRAAWYMLRDWWRHWHPQQRPSSDARCRAASHSSHTHDRYHRRRRRALEFAWRTHVLEFLAALDQLDVTTQLPTLAAVGVGSERSAFSPASRRNHPRSSSSRLFNLACLHGELSDDAEDALSARVVRAAHHHPGDSSRGQRWNDRDHRHHHGNDDDCTVPQSPMFASLSLHHDGVGQDQQGWGSDACLSPHIHTQNAQDVLSNPHQRLELWKLQAACVTAWATACRLDADDDDNSRVVQESTSHRNMRLWNHLLDVTAVGCGVNENQRKLLPWCGLLGMVAATTANSDRRPRTEHVDMGGIVQEVWRRVIDTTLTQHQRLYFLELYTELVSEGSYFDDPFCLYKAMAPLIKLIESHLPKPSLLKHESNCLLQGLAVLLSRRGNLHSAIVKAEANHPRGISFPLTNLLAQLSLIFDSPIDWIAPNMPSIERTRQIQALQCAGILGMCVYDDTQHEDSRTEPSNNDSHRPLFDATGPSSLRATAYRVSLSVSDQMSEHTSKFFSKHSLENAVPPLSKESFVSSSPKSSKSEPPPCLAEYLNDDLTRNVFSFLNHKRLRRARCVSSKWKLCADDPRLWCSLYKAKYGFQSDDPKITHSDPAVSQPPVAWKNEFDHRCQLEHDIRFEVCRQDPRWRVRTCGYIGCLTVLTTPKGHQRHCDKHRRQHAAAARHVQRAAAARPKPRQRPPSSANAASNRNDSESSCGCHGDVSYVRRRSGPTKRTRYNCTASLSLVDT